MNCRSLAFSGLFLLATASPGFADDLQPSKDAGPYVPSPQSVVADMLKVAEVGPADFVIDLGSGDGRIVLTAAKVFGAQGFGVEIKDELVKKSNEAARREGLSDRVKFIKQDLFKTDISQATVLTMYLLPDTVNLLKDKFLAELKPGTRIISHDYPLTGWIPEKYIQMDLEDKVHISGVTTTLIYMYVVPANGGEPPAGDAAAQAAAHARVRQREARRQGGAARGREAAWRPPQLPDDRAQRRVHRAGERQQHRGHGRRQGALERHARRMKNVKAGDRITVTRT